MSKIKKETAHQLIELTTKFASKNTLETLLNTKDRELFRILGLVLLLLVPYSIIRLFCPTFFVPNNIYDFIL